MAKCDEGEEMARVRVGKAALVPGWARRHKGEESARQHEGAAALATVGRVNSGARGTQGRGTRRGGAYDRVDEAARRGGEGKGRPSNGMGERWHERDVSMGVCERREGMSEWRGGMKGRRGQGGTRTRALVQRSGG